MPEDREDYDGQPATIKPTIPELLVEVIEELDLGDDA